MKNKITDLTRHEALVDAALMFSGTCLAPHPCGG
jgi:hypothetical protein